MPMFPTDAGSAVPCIG